VPCERRGARYRCVLVLARSAEDAAPLVACGSWEGRIATQPAGSGGFGYDPLFVPDGEQRSAAQLPAAEKNALSHRARALGGPAGADPATRTAGTVARTASPLPPSPPQLPPLSLYVHFPWCVRKCPYCDFNSHTLQGELPANDYVEALLRDLSTQTEAAQGRELQSIFLGGGTPSLFAPEALARLLAGCANAERRC
jgi:hypothetical protein